MPLPALFPDWPTFVAAALIVAVAQLIYATVGFGAGMFSVALLALVLHDLAPIVAALLLITLVTEVGVLLRAWRHAQLRVLLWLLPTTAVGMWLGTRWLVAGNAADLKRVLGGVVLLAGLWFLLDHRRSAAGANDENLSGGERGMARTWAGPIGLLAGVLAGLFGTGGPPVIVYLRARRLDKGAFRATLLSFFLLMSGLRLATYAQAELMNRTTLYGAACLLPGALLGIGGGLLLHERLPETTFGRIVAALLVLLGTLLLLTGGSH